MKIDDIDALTESLDGVRRSTKDGLAQWRYHGRLVARQLGDGEVVIRSDFGHRDGLLRDDPSTFSVPRRFAKHMMVVADLADGDRQAVADAVVAAWELQRRAD